MSNIDKLTSSELKAIDQALVSDKDKIMIATVLKYAYDNNLVVLESSIVLKLIKLLAEVSDHKVIRVKVKPKSVRDIPGLYPRKTAMRRTKYE